MFYDFWGSSIQWCCRWKYRSFGYYNVSSCQSDSSLNDELVLDDTLTSESISDIHDSILKDTPTPISIGGINYYTRGIAEKIKIEGVEYTNIVLQKKKYTLKNRLFWSWISIFHKRCSCKWKLLWILLCWIKFRYDSMKDQVFRNNSFDIRMLECLCTKRHIFYSNKLFSSECIILQ